MLFLALSCLQGRPMASAWRELSAVLDRAGVDGGIQLTPGNHPTPGFEAWVAQAGRPTRRHHGFDWTSRRRQVWTADGTCLTDAESVHPPESSAPAPADWLGSRPPDDPLLETMYPGYALGTGAEVERAIDLGVHLAVDVSHVFIQRTAGVMTEATWRRLAAYERISEVHVSANDGRRDAHAPLEEGTFGLDWARERAEAGVPIVLECYLHRLSDDERQRQIARVLPAR